MTSSQLKAANLAAQPWYFATVVLLASGVESSSSHERAVRAAQVAASPYVIWMKIGAQVANLSQKALVELTQTSSTVAPEPLLVEEPVSPPPLPPLPLEVSPPPPPQEAVRRAKAIA